MGTTYAGSLLNVQAQHLTHTFCNAQEYERSAEEGLEKLKEKHLAEIMAFQVSLLPPCFVVHSLVFSQVCCVASLYQKHIALRK